MSLLDFFALISGMVAVLTAGLVAFHPNILYAAISLTFSLMSVAGLYAVLGAGMQGTAAAYDLAKFADPEKIKLGDLSFDQAKQSAWRVNDLIGEISTAAQEQSRGIEQVGLAVGQLDMVTQQNAALVEQLAAAAQSLQGQSGQLNASMGAFRVNA